MELRRPRMDELNKLRKMHESFKEQFKFPDFSLLSSVYVVVHNGEIIGFGAVQPIFEAVIVLDQNKPVEERVQALDLLEQIAETELSSQEVNQIHAFVQSRIFENLLKNRFGYKETKGKAMVKNLV